MKILGIIPARYKSTRFPGKPLALILGKPLIIHVAEKAAAALGKENVIIATEDHSIREKVESFGYQVELTQDTHPTGTDRLWEVAARIEADIYINIQGDEPMVDPEDILKIADHKRIYPDKVINGMCGLLPGEDPNNINIPKVLVNRENELIYMSRLPIPGVKKMGAISPKYLKQVCIYAFNREELFAYGEMVRKAEYEFFEDIEILRFFDIGIKIKMVETKGASLAVDVPEDVQTVESAILNYETGIH